MLVGAALTQYPSKFRALVGEVGAYDLLRSELHPNEAFSITEQGTVTDPEQFKALYAYSPYHHVVDGTAYPAVFLLTGENDARVDPANSWKMAARLQAATALGRPVYLWTGSKSGHDNGARGDILKRQADIYAFLFQQLGVPYRPLPDPRKAKPPASAIGRLDARRKGARPLAWCESAFHDSLKRNGGKSQGGVIVARKRQPSERKLRTREHVLEDLSFNFVERQIFLRGFAVYHLVTDYGLDLMMLTYNPEGEVENGHVMLQVKATDAVHILKGGQSLALRVEVADLRWWQGESMPVILALYDGQGDKAYWLYVQQYLTDNRVNLDNLAAKQDRVTVRIPLRNRLHPRAIEQFRRFRDRLQEQMKGAVHHGP